MIGRSLFWLISISWISMLSSKYLIACFNIYFPKHNDYDPLTWLLVDQIKCLQVQSKTIVEISTCKFWEVTLCYLYCHCEVLILLVKFSLFRMNASDIVVANTKVFIDWNITLLLINFPSKLLPAWLLLLQSVMIKE